MSVEKSGFVIAIDGPDGVGKTSQVALLDEYLSGQGHTVHKTRISGGTPIGELLRDVSLSDTTRSARTDLHISLAMAEALGDDITTRKANGETIIIDRSPLAIVAYNGYGSEMVNKQDALDACRNMVKHCQIDLLIYLTTAQNILEKRRERRSHSDYFEKKGSDYHRRVRQGYRVGLEFLEQAQLPISITVIDATSDIPTVHQSITDAI